jgi:hypothetical protein
VTIFVQGRSHYLVCCKFLFIVLKSGRPDDGLRNKLKLVAMFILLVVYDNAVKYSGTSNYGHSN